MEDMQIPEFLQNNDEDDIQEEMLALIPDIYDKSEGQHFYNFTRPTAMIAAQLRGQNIPEAIKLIWPKFSTGEFLDLHAENRYLKRKEAQAAFGKITITGTAGIVIPAGYIVSTEGKNDIPSKDYATIVPCTISEEGTVTVEAVAVTPGADGNTASDTIIVNTSSYDDVESVTNEFPFIGGIDEEDDDSLYARISEYDQNIGNQNTGNPSDYKRWAESVEGTGTANIARAKDSSAVVTIVLTDGNGDPANEELCEKVYNYIMSPEDDLKRLAPCGANLTVIPPVTQTLTITGKLELTSGSIESVTALFVKNLKEYFPDAIDNKKVLYHRICNVLGDIEGVYDFSELTVNGGTANIVLEDGVFPYIKTENVTFTLVE